MCLFYILIRPENGENNTFCEYRQSTLTSMWIVEKVCVLTSFKVNLTIEIVHIYSVIGLSREYLSTYVFRSNVYIYLK